MGTYDMHIIAQDFLSKGDWLKVCKVNPPEEKEPIISPLRSRQLAGEENLLSAHEKINKVKSQSSVRPENPRENETGFQCTNKIHQLGVCQSIPVMKTYF